MPTDVAHGFAEDTITVRKETHDVKNDQAATLSLFVNSRNGSRLKMTHECDVAGVSDTSSVYRGIYACTMWFER